jgi:hypothetical protein
MQISQAFLIVFLAGAAAGPARSQSTTPEQQGRALELLRQTIAQQQQAAPMPMNSAPVKPSPGDQQNKAIQLLRETTAKEYAAPASPAAPVPARPQNGQRLPTGKIQPSSKLGVNQNAVPAPVNPVVSPVVPEQPSGPKTKQQKLQDLLGLYKADKLSPAEYQVERAKILAEP